MMLSEVESWVADDSDNPEVDLGPPTDRGPPEGGPWGPPEASLGAPPRGLAASAVDLDDFLGDYEQSQASVWSTEADFDIPPVVPSLREEAAAAAAAEARTAAAAAATAVNSKPQSTSAATRDKASWPLLHRETFSGGTFSRTSGGPMGAPVEGPLGGPQTVFGQGPPPRCSSPGFSYCDKIPFNCSPVDKPLVAAELFVSCMLIFEVSLRSLVLGPSCFSSSAHLFDCTITTLSVVLFLNSGDIRVLFRGSPGPSLPPEGDAGGPPGGAPGGPRGPRTSPEAPDDFLRELLTALRIATQVVRLVPLAMHQRRAKLPRDGVDFSRLDPHDDL
ncbi:uncharacterized protein EMH_0072350 [Eimeria mitis]|uniref:Uncharacterized protein n=1 Tax=Eimeria mitis TaxID=44415 RepID=U6KBT5_9EIME|nr:uncharacterized protein EMH_0072350 [Eimeria mitis]CDJ35384.1 hypothetical protein, conserved [Eimeria mitis]